MAEKVRTQRQGQAAAAALFPLRGISIGIWSARRSRKWLLCMPNRQTFVLLIVYSQTDASRRAGTPWDRVIQAAHHAVDKRNPFSPVEEHDPQPHTVIALEVQWGDIQGLDYTFPLHQDGRLVLEAQQVVKRTFRTVADAQQYYQWTSAADHGAATAPAAPAPRLHHHHHHSHHSSREASLHSGSVQGGGAHVQGSVQGSLAGRALPSLPPPHGGGGPGTQGQASGLPPLRVANRDQQGSGHAVGAAAGLTVGRLGRRAGLPPTHTPGSSQSSPHYPRSLAHMGASHLSHSSHSLSHSLHEPGGLTHSGGSSMRVGRSSRGNRITIGHHHHNDSHSRRVSLQHRRLTLEHSRSSSLDTRSRGSSAHDLQALDAPADPGANSNAGTTTAAVQGHAQQLETAPTLALLPRQFDAVLGPQQQQQQRQGLSNEGWSAWLSGWMPWGGGLTTAVDGYKPDPNFQAPSSVVSPHPSMQHMADPAPMLACGMDAMQQGLHGLHGLHGDSSYACTPGMLSPASRMSMEHHAGPGRPAVVAHVAAPSLAHASNQAGARLAMQQAEASRSHAWERGSAWSKGPISNQSHGDAHEEHAVSKRAHAACAPHVSSHSQAPPTQPTEPTPVMSRKVASAGNLASLDHTLPALEALDSLSQPTEQLGTTSTHHHRLADGSSGGGGGTAGAGVGLRAGQGQAGGAGAARVSGIGTGRGLTDSQLNLNLTQEEGRFYTQPRAAAPRPMLQRHSQPALRSAQHSSLLQQQQQSATHANGLPLVFRPGGALTHTDAALGGDVPLVSRPGQGWGSSARPTACLMVDQEQHIKQGSGERHQQRQGPSLQQGPDVLTQQQGPGGLQQPGRAGLAQCQGAGVRAVAEAGTSVASDSGAEAHAGIPPACRWTTASAVYHGRTLIITFKDPAVQPMLSQVVKSDMRVLKLYESGLPAWAVFLPSYGLWYRPWMRRVTFLLFTAISVASMILGFYDLYKNVPIVRQAMAALSAKIFPPATQLFEWLEKHAQIRLSILLTYLFSKSPLFITLMRFLRTCMGSMSQLLGPMLEGLRTALTPLMSLFTYLASLFTYCFSSLLYLLQPVATLLASCGSQLYLLGCSLASGTSLLLAPPAQALWAVLLLVGQACRTLGQLGAALVQGPLYMVGQAVAGLQTVGVQLAGQLRVVSATLGLMWQAVASWGKAAKAAVPVATATGRAVAAAARAAPTPSAAASSWSLFSRAGQEAWGIAELARVTLFRCFKAFQAVVNFFVAMGLAVNRHRVSLLIELRRYLLTNPRLSWMPRTVTARLIHSQPSVHFNQLTTNNFNQLTANDLVDENLGDAASTLDAVTLDSTQGDSPFSRSNLGRSSFDTTVSAPSLGMRFWSRLGGSDLGTGLGAGSINGRGSLDARLALPDGFSQGAAAGMAQAGRQLEQQEEQEEYEGISSGDEWRGVAVEDGRSPVRGGLRQGRRADAAGSHRMETNGAVGWEAWQAQAGAGNGRPPIPRRRGTQSPSPTPMSPGALYAAPSFALASQPHQQPAWISSMVDAGAVGQSMGSSRVPNTYSSASQAVQLVTGAGQLLFTAAGLGGAQARSGRSKQHHAPPRRTSSCPGPLFEFESPEEAGDGGGAKRSVPLGQLESVSRALQEAYQNGARGSGARSTEPVPSGTAYAAGGVGWLGWQQGDETPPYGDMTDMPGQPILQGGLGGVYGPGFDMPGQQGGEDEDMSYGAGMDVPGQQGGQRRGAGGQQGGGQGWAPSSWQGEAGMPWLDSRPEHVAVGAVRRRGYALGPFS